jgi:hypothetical protein
VRNKKLVAGIVPSLGAAAALIVTTSLIAEIAAEPTWDPGIDSSTWTPATAVTALFFGHGAFHGSFEAASVLFGLATIVVVSVIVGSLGVAFLVYCLGWSPHPAAAALLGAAWGLAMEILLVNLLCNWLQAENGISTSLPAWAWFVAFGAWGATLGLVLARSGRHLPLGEAGRTSANQSGDRLPNPAPLSEGGRVRLAGPSPQLSAEPHPAAPHGEAPR